MTSRMIYDKPYDPLFPVICFDERPCFLIGEVMAPLNAPLNQKPGKTLREHYAYSKNGSCCLLAAIEPLTGARLGQVHKQRTKREYALFLKALTARYPDAVKILLVQDNLNTHCLSALYETFDATEAFALAQRFEFHFTPKSASWLNMIEIEFSALSRQCLNRRIPTKEILECQVLSLLQERQDKAIKINWQFSIHKARTTFETAYSGIRRNTV